MKFTHALSIAAVTVLSPTVALACGGFFCSTVAVDQNAERILFEVNDDDTVTAHVEISYSGAPDGFSWVIPVPDTPVLEVVPQSALQMLDAASGVTIIPPPTTCSSFDLFGGGIALASADSGERNGGVYVEDLERVGAFDPEVVSGDDAGLIVDWLNTNGYLITAEMEPFVADYVAAGMKFLAMKLAPGAGIGDISPIKMTYPGTLPVIPLVLTAVAAEPEMGIIVFIAGNSRYESGNYENILIPTERVQADPATGQSNYQNLVSLMIDDAGGEAFVTEFAGPTSEIDPQNAFFFPDDWEESVNYVQDLLNRHSNLTRLYSRISAWEIGTDPGFAPSFDGAVSRVHDLSDRPAVEVCGNTPPEIPCGDTYCGVGSTCATTDEGIDGCLCKEGTVARSITDPSARAVSTVACQELSFDLMQSVTPDVLPAAADPCDGVACGNGDCLPVNGFPTCACDEGFAAIPNPSLAGGLACVTAYDSYEAAQVFEWAAPGCSSVGANAPLALGALVLLALRRRRRVA